MDNNKVIEKTINKIAISNFEEEDIEMERKKSNLIRNLGIALCVFLSTTGAVFATNYLINKFGPNSSEGSQIAVNNGYVANAPENSIVDSFMIDNYNFYIAFNKEKLGLSYDDILQNLENAQIGEKSKEYLIVTNEKGEEIFNNTNTAFSLTEEDNIIFYTATAKEFPVSQKLYINFDGRKEVLNVPENMQGEIVEYKLKSISEESWKFEKSGLSNTAFKIYLTNCDSIAQDERSYVETSDGKKFGKSQRNMGDGGLAIDSDGKISYYTTFNLTKFDATDEITVHLYKTDGSEAIIKLER